MPNPTLKAVIFWQWANQSLNGSVFSGCHYTETDGEYSSMRELFECQQEY